MTTEGHFERRSLLKGATLGLGAAVGVTIALPILRVLFFPLSRQTVSRESGPLDATAVERVTADAPLRVELYSARRRDAWSLAEGVPLGAAWLVRSAATGEIQAFSASCPHLGCAVDFDASTGRFRCPCHDSGFALDGRRLIGPAKRGLDPLPVSLEDGRVRVTYKRFQSDVADRIEL